MTEEKADAVSGMESSQEVDRIRDIIFGTHMRDYEQRFQAVRRDVERLQKEIDRLAERLADQDRYQAGKLQDLRGEMRQSDDDLRDELRQTAQRLATEKVDRVALGELFIDLGTHLKTGGSLSDELRELGEQVQD